MSQSLSRFDEETFLPVTTMKTPWPEKKQKLSLEIDNYSSFYSSYLTKLFFCFSTSGDVY